MLSTLSKLMGRKHEQDAVLHFIHQDIGRCLGELRTLARLTPADAAAAVQLGAAYGPRLIEQIETGQAWNERAARRLFDFYRFALDEQDEATRAVA